MTQISQQRKKTYYIGMGMAAIGFLMFVSTFFIGPSSTHDFARFEAQAKAAGLFAISGILLIIAGFVVASVGARGLAGSGVVLDPEKAREELKPFSEMAGGIVKDALDAAEIKPGVKSPEKVVMIKCQRCGKLNAEDSKFCSECGSKF